MLNESNSVERFQRTSLGVSFVGKFGKMRKATEWVIYPTTDEKDTIYIQNDTRWAEIDKESGDMWMSASHSFSNNMTLYMDKLRGKAEHIQLEPEILGEIMTAVNDRHITNHRFDNIIRSSDVTDDEINGVDEAVSVLKKHGFKLLNEYRAPYSKQTSWSGNPNDPWVPGDGDPDLSDEEDEVDDVINDIYDKINEKYPNMAVKIKTMKEDCDDDFDRITVTKKFQIILNKEEYDKYAYDEKGEPLYENSEVDKYIDELVDDEPMASFDDWDEGPIIVVSKTVYTGDDRD